MRRILCALIDEKVRDLLMQTLKGEYSITFVTSGEEAYEFAIKEKPDLVITDVALPGMMDGFQLFMALKKRVETKKLPVLFLTPYLVKDRVFTLGARQFVSLPNLPEEFREHIKSAIVRAVEEVGSD